MVAGLKFLSKKSFNPQNLVNQKSVWEAEQESKREEARQRERDRQLTIERDHEQLARSRDGASGGQKASLSFMYDAPPGLDDKKGMNEYDAEFEFESSRSGTGTGTGAKEVDPLLFERKTGDDDAAAAFRQMLAGASSQIDETNDDSEALHHDPADGLASSLIISGSTAEANMGDKSQLTQLEKAVGKRNGSSAVTYEEQIARFPQLKNAPVAMKRNGDGEEANKTNLNFKPLGAQIRNVRCLVCKIWGHSKGDRECKLSGWDPFSSTSISATGAAASVPMKPSSIMPDRKEGDYYGPSSSHKKYDQDQIAESDDDSRRERPRHRKKKSKRHKESRRDRDDRKSSGRRRRSYERDGDSSDSYSSDESDRRRRRDRKRKERKRRKRSRSCSPCSSVPSRSRT